jgi:2-aminoadipate transaminase
MFVWAKARSPDIDTNVLYSFALQEKVAFVPSSVFDPDGGLTNAMRLNFTRNPPDKLAEGIRRLRRAVERYLAARP